MNLWKDSRNKMKKGKRERKKKRREKIVKENSTVRQNWKNCKERKTRKKELKLNRERQKNWKKTLGEKKKKVKEEKKLSKKVLKEFGMDQISSTCLTQKLLTQNFSIAYPQTQKTKLDRIKFLRKT